MAKRSDDRREKIERVMRAFKHGDLESGSGAKVTDRRQAVAIGLAEARAADRRSPDDAAEPGADVPTRAALYAKARTMKIPGRSKMSKAELARAVRA